jgi:hypothetical protein
MDEQELRKQIGEIVYITRWTDDKQEALVSVLTPEEYIEIEDKLIELFNKLKSK